MERRARVLTRDISSRLAPLGGFERNKHDRSFLLRDRQFSSLWKCKSTRGVGREEEKGGKKRRERLVLEGQQLDVEAGREGVPLNSMKRSESRAERVTRGTRRTWIACLNDKYFVIKLLFRAESACLYVQG